MDLYLTEEQLKQAVNNVAVTDDGLKLLGHLISISGAGIRGVNPEPRRGDYLSGRADYGEEIIEMVKLYSFEKYIELCKKDVNQKKEN